MIEQKTISLKIDAQIISDLDDLITAFPEFNVGRDEFVSCAVRYLLDISQCQLNVSPDVVPDILYSIKSGLM